MAGTIHAGHLPNSIKKPNLKCLYTNSQSIRGKILELNHLDATTNLDIIAITETWLSPEIYDNEVQIGDKILFRKDRLIANGGGVAMYIHPSLKPSIYESKTLDKIPESLWIKLAGVQAPTLVGVIYRPPTTSSEIHGHILEALQIISELPNLHTLLLGDFNLPNMNLLDSNARENSGFSSQFAAAVAQHGLTEHVKQETRWAPSGKSSKLDLVLTNSELLVDNLQLGPPLGLSDHATIKFDYMFENHRITSSTSPVKNYYKADFNSISEGLLNLNWNKELDLPSIDEVWIRFTEKLWELINEFTPSFTPRIKKNKMIRNSTSKLLKKEIILEHPTTDPKPRGLGKV